MPDVLGIVGSARRWGNCELLVREALRGAQAEGAAIHMLRLDELRILPCTGCMRCVIGAKPCPEQDDMDWLIRIVEAADGLVLAAPTYWLGPAAQVKLVLDRLLMVTGRVDRPLPTARPALTIATAGLEAWQGVALPFLNALAGGFGFRPVESVMAFAPGPGEILLDEPLVARVFAAGRRVARGDLTPTPPDGVCPICGCDAFILSGSRATCPICAREAALEWGPDGVRLRFDPVEDEASRWTADGLRRHMIEWVQATGPRFVAKREAVRARRAAYRQAEVEWLHPPEAERAGGGGGDGR